MLPIPKRYAVFCFSLLTALGATAWKSAARPESPLTSNTNSAGFRLALPRYEYAFPRDHGSHPAYQTEWWYYTGHLRSTEPPRNFGYQLTFFRRALVPELKNRTSQWATHDVIFAHLALTDETGKKFYFTNRISRATLQLAGAQTGNDSTPRIWIDDWSLIFAPGEQRLRAMGESGSTPFGIELRQRALKDPVIHGEKGVSQKSAGAGRASHYYSLARLQTEGKVRLGDNEYSVTGNSWFDHEFGSNVLASNQTGWDWFSLQLDDGRELMLYQLRLKNGGIDEYSSGTLVEKDGSSRHVKRDDFQIEVVDYWTSPTSGAKYPARWSVKIPREKIDFEIEPTVNNQELHTKGSVGITYCEGSVRVSGQNGIIGKGYVEMTGYAEEFDGTF